MSVKLPPQLVDRWTGGSLTQRPKGSFAVSQLKQFLLEVTVITKHDFIRNQKIEIPHEFPILKNIAAYI